MKIGEIFRKLTGRAVEKVASKVRAYYASAEYSRLYQWAMAPTREDDAIRSDLRAMRDNARELARNNPFVRQFLRLTAVNVIGPDGIRLQSQVKDNSGKLNKGINDKIETAYAEWSRAVSVCGKLSRTQFSALGVKIMKRDGEFFVRKIIGYPHNESRFALQMIDAVLVDHEYNVEGGPGRNEIRLGVEVDGYGRPVAFHVFDRYPSQAGATRQRIPAEEMIHVFDPEFANQTRGVPAFSGSMKTLKMLDGYVEAELVAARVGAAKMGWWQKKDSDTPSLDPNQNYTTEVEPGQFGIAPDGYELQEWSPDHPAAAFSQFVKAALRTACSDLGVSYNVMANDLEGVNYSSMRAGILPERDNWRALQKLWIAAFERPVFEAWLSTALLAGAVSLDSRDPRKFRAVRFIPRGWAWVDPKKDIDAAILALKWGMGSRKKYLGEQGEDFEETVQDLADEAQIAQDAGVTIVDAAPKAAPGEEGGDEADDEAGEDGDEKAKEKDASAGGRRFSVV